jgi:hypothetical protein
MEAHGVLQVGMGCGFLFHAILFTGLFFCQFPAAFPNRETIHIRIKMQQF